MLEQINLPDDKSAIPDIYPDNDSNIFLFLRNYKLASGKIKILSRQLYKLYTKTTLEPCGPIPFKLEVSNYITTSGKYYLINQNLNDILEKIKIDEKIIEIKSYAVSPMAIKKFELFLSEYQIEPGNGIFIRPKALYYFFDKWADENKKQTFSYRKFNNLLKMYLNNPVYLKLSPHYGLHRKFHEKINKEDIIKAKAWAKKFKAQQD